MVENVFSEFLQKKGLYDEIEINKDNIHNLIDLIAGKIKIESFCPCCKTDRVFEMQPILTRTIYEDGEEYNNELAIDLVHIQNRIEMEQAPEPKPSIGKALEWNWTERTLEEFTRVMVFPFKCSMDDSHKIDYIVRTEGNKMKKIGQFPSIADLSFPELEKYKNIIDGDLRKELRRAIGLNAHGVGAGSYVYLRRIFEKILDVAKDRAVEDKIIDECNYKDAHIEDRIKMLNSYIPNFICENKQIYKIVSKGIHELSEEECIQYFPVLKNCILLILKQWKEISEENKLKAEMQIALNKISSDLG